MSTYHESHGTRRCARPLRRRRQRRPAGARLSEASARERDLAARRLDLRHVGRRALRHDGGARPARRSRGVHARAAAERRVPAALALAAAAARYARLPAAGDDRRAGRKPRRDVARARDGADRARRLRDRRDGGRARRRRARVRARVLRAHDAAGDLRAGGARVGGDQRARAAAADRREDRNRRRVGPELPARLRVRPAGRRADRELPLPADAIRASPRTGSRGCATGSSASRSCRRCAR